MVTPSRASDVSGGLYLRFSQLLIRILGHWSFVAFLFLSGVLWGITKLPFYQEGLPYLYDLGGLALVAFYLSLGCLSVCVGVGPLLMAPRLANFSTKRLSGLAMSSAVLAWGWIALYFWFMNIAVH